MESVGDETPLKASSVHFSTGDDDYRQWLVDRSHYSLYFGFLYVVFVFLGQWIMRSRKPLQLSKVFLVWNVGLTLFSIVGTIKVFPEFYETLTKRGFFASYCRAGEEFYTGKTGYWVYMFHISKLIEFGDTVFLVLRKRPVIFLHWYHHATVLAYTWLTYGQNVGPTRWGMMMNFFIHSVMYAYYAAKSARLRLPGGIAPCITSMQMAQFVVGLWACCHGLWMLAVHGQGSCDATWSSSASSVVLYVSYFVLFAQFFRQSYGQAGKKALDNKVDAPIANGHHVEKSWSNVVANGHGKKLE